MASKRKKQDTDTAHATSSFAEILFKISHRFSLPKVFDDFLTMSIAACTRNPETKLSHYEDEYLQTIAYYKGSELRYEFPNAFAQLVVEMEERIDSSLGNDVLGEFFEQNISNGRNGQFFTPYPICQFIASIPHTDSVYDAESSKERTLRILEPACGSGRMLLAAHKVNGTGHEYYGIDIDRTCVKMTALNLFLNGVWNSEVMCANSLMPDDFVIAYHISFLPLGIFKIEEKEKSKLWHLHRNSFTNAQREKIDSDIPFVSTPLVEIKKDDGTQLNLF